METVKIYSKWFNGSFTLREIIGILGATLDDCGRVGFEDENPILEKYPVLINTEYIDPQFIKSAEDLADKLILIKEKNDRKY